MGYKNSKKRYPQKASLTTECILDMHEKISKTGRSQNYRASKTGL